MKAALVIKSFSGRRGGGEGYAFRLAGELSRLGHEIHVYANSWDEPEVGGLIYHRVPMVGFSSILKLITFPRNAGRLLRADRFDVINGLTQVLEQDVFRLGGGVAKHWIDVRARSCQFPLLVRLRPLNIINLFIEKRIFRGGRCKRFIVNSRLCGEQLARYYGVPGERIDLVYNGVDTDRFNPVNARHYRARMREGLGARDDEILILTASTNPRRKGLGFLLDALASMGERGRKVKLLAVGSRRTAAFERKARSLGLRERVTFESWAGEMERFYGAADLFVLPTMYDPFANVCLEALACGLPVVTTRENGAAEVVEEAGGGTIIGDSRDVSALASAIEGMLDPAARERMSRSAAAGAKKYTWERTARAVLDVYGKAIKEKESGRE